RSGETRAIGSNNRFDAGRCGCVHGAQSALWRPAGKVISVRRYLIVASLTLPGRDCCLQLLFGLRTLMRALRCGESQPWRRKSVLAFANADALIAINITRRRGALPFRR